MKKVRVVLIMITLAVSGFFIFQIINHDDESYIDVGTMTIGLSDESDIIMDPTYGEVIVNQAIVVLEEHLVRKDAESIANEIGGNIIGEIEKLFMYQIELKSKRMDQLLDDINTLKGVTGVKHVSINTILYNEDMEGNLWTPIDSDAYRMNSNQHMYFNMGFPQSWRYIMGSEVELKPVTIAVLDSYIDKGNPEFEGDMNFELDYSDATFSDDILQHGTKVINIIAADYQDNIGISGVASILGKKGTIISNNNKDTKYINRGDDGKTAVFNLAKTMYTQIGKGATVINCSFGPKFAGDYNQPAAFIYYCQNTSCSKDSEGKNIFNIF